jgi:hypothetical protein
VEHLDELSGKSEYKASIETSRRSFLAGSRLALVAGAALALGAIRSSPSQAGGPDDYNRVSAFFPARMSRRLLDQ